MTNQERVQVAAKVGITPDTVRKWELGKKVHPVFAAAIEAAVKELKSEKSNSEHEEVSQ